MFTALQVGLQPQMDKELESSSFGDELFPPFSGSFARGGDGAGLSKSRCGVEEMLLCFVAQPLSHF